MAPVQKRTMLPAALPALCLLLQSCDSAQQSQPSLSQSFQPKAVAALDAQTNLDIRFTVTINGMVVSTDNQPAQMETALSIDPDAFVSGSNTVTVEFFAIDNNTQRYPLASAEQQVEFSQSIDRISLSGLYYQYTDTDNDNLFDVHELAIQPADVDNDGTANVYDTDSDNDGITDGIDPSPYGTINVPFDQTPSFIVESPSGDGTPYYVTRFTGPTTEVLQLLNTLPAVELRTPDLWPGSSWPSINRERGLNAFELGNGSGSLCPQLRISFDTSSIRSTISQTALWYFRRFDSDPFVAPLGTAEVSNLNIIDNTQNQQNSDWNDALRIIMVPDGTVGWIELWSEPDYTGQVCRINLTTEM
ncbi:MAG: hypothetical protein AAF404_04825 [Pseudomonadota bacterium]